MFLAVFCFRCGGKETQHDVLAYLVHSSYAVEAGGPCCGQHPTPRPSWLIYWERSPRHVRCFGAGAMSLSIEFCTDRTPPYPQSNVGRPPAPPVQCWRSLFLPKIYQRPPHFVKDHRNIGPGVRGDAQHWTGGTGAWLLERCCLCGSTHWRVAFVSATPGAPNSGMGDAGVCWLERLGLGPFGPSASGSSWRRLILEAKTKIEQSKNAKLDHGTRYTNSLNI